MNCPCPKCRHLATTQRRNQVDALEMALFTEVRPDWPRTRILKTLAAKYARPADTIGALIHYGQQQITEQIMEALTNCPACSGEGQIQCLPWRQFHIAHPQHKADPLPHDKIQQWFIERGHTVTYTINGETRHALPFGDNEVCWKCEGRRVA